MFAERAVPKHAHRRFHPLAAKLLSEKRRRLRGVLRHFRQPRFQIGQRDIVLLPRSHLQREKPLGIAVKPSRRAAALLHAHRQARQCANSAVQRHAASPFILPDDRAQQQQRKRNRQRRISQRLKLPVFQRIQHGTDRHRNQRDRRVDFGRIGQRQQAGESRAQRTPPRLDIFRIAQHRQRDEKQHRNRAVDLLAEQQRGPYQQPGCLACARYPAVFKDCPAQSRHGRRRAERHRHVYELHRQVQIQPRKQAQQDFHRQADAQLIGICVQIVRAHHLVIAAREQLRRLLHDGRVVDLLRAETNCQNRRRRAPERRQRPAQTGMSFQQSEQRQRGQHAAQQQRRALHRRNRQKRNSLGFAAPCAQMHALGQPRSNQRQQRGQRQNQRRDLAKPIDLPFLHPVFLFTRSCPQTAD